MSIIADDEVHKNSIIETLQTNVDWENLDIEVLRGVNQHFWLHPFNVFDVILVKDNSQNKRQKLQW